MPHFFSSSARGDRSAIGDNRSGDYGSIQTQVRAPAPDEDEGKEEQRTSKSIVFFGLIVNDKEWNCLGEWVNG